MDINWIQVSERELRREDKVVIDAMLIDLLKNNPEATTLTYAKYEDTSKRVTEAVWTLAICPEVVMATIYHSPGEVTVVRYPTPGIPTPTKEADDFDKLVAAYKGKND